MRYYDTVWLTIRTALFTMNRLTPQARVTAAA
jgi:hypothetical protein